MKRLIVGILAVLLIVSNISINKIDAFCMSRGNSNIDGNFLRSWKSDSSGWWYEEGSWYPRNQWYKIDGAWYYFDGSGYMESNCYRDGCWLGSSGAWNTAYSNGHWKSNSTGWWFEDNGWYPVNQWLKINGSWYYFKASGYMAADEWIGNDYVDKSGAYVPGKKKSTTTTTTNNNNNSSSSNNSSSNNKNNDSSSNTTVTEDLTHCSKGGNHDWVVYKAAHQMYGEKYSPTGILIEHDYCNSCHADLSLIDGYDHWYDNGWKGQQVDTPLWQIEDFGYSQDVWNSLSLSERRSTWHQLKTGCTNTSYSKSSYMISFTFPATYKCNKCGKIKGFICTPIHYYNAQNNMVTDNDYDLYTTY